MKDTRVALANPWGIHCAECTADEPCDPCAGQIRAETEYVREGAAFKSRDYSRAVAAAIAEASGSGEPWSVLDPWHGYFLVVSERDALELFPGSVISTFGPAGVR